MIDRFHLLFFPNGEVIESFNNSKDAAHLIREAMMEYDEVDSEDFVILETWGTLQIKDSINRITHKQEKDNAK